MMSTAKIGPDYIAATRACVDLRVRAKRLEDAASVVEEIYTDAKLREDVATALAIKLEDLRNSNASLRELCEKLLEVLRVIPPERLEILAAWFDQEQRNRPEWKGGDVQVDLRRMGTLSQAAMVAAGDTS